MTKSEKSLKNQLKSVGRFPKFLALVGVSSLILPVFSYGATAATVRPSATLSSRAQDFTAASGARVVTSSKIHVAGIASRVGADGALHISSHYSALLGLHRRHSGSTTTTTVVKVTTTTSAPTTSTTVVASPTTSTTVPPTTTVVPTTSTTLAPTTTTTVRATTTTLAPVTTTTVRVTTTTVAPVTTTTVRPTTTTTVAPAPTLSSSAISFAQGVYVGPATPTGVASFASTTGTKITVASEYLPSNSGWAGMDGAGGSLSWLTGAWQNSGYRLSLGVPMIPTNSSNVPVGTLAQGASGAFNQYFVTLAQTLVAAGEGNSYLRPGWEFDGNWYPWQATTASTEASYAAYFQQIVTAMRSVPGENFQFVWNPDAAAFTTAGYSVAAAYPGNAYVNVIGLDLYDQSWVTPLTPANAWANTFLPMLSAASAFANQQGKPIAMTEWGAVIRTDGHGLGDDPLYINNMINWMNTASHNVIYESYFNGNTFAPGGSPDLDLRGGNFPQSLAAFEADLG